MIEIHRRYENEWTDGILFYEDFKCFTLELPDENNKPFISCIPAGEYQGRVHFSPKNGKVISIDNVPGRTHIQIHKGNFTSDIYGCILVGDSLKFLDGDNIPDVTNSSKTLNELLKIIPKTVTIRIY